MKKLITPVLFLGVLAIFTTGCNKNVEVPLEQQITGKWTIESAIGNYTMMGVSTQDTTWYTSEDFVEFKQDGSLNIEESNTPYNGKWKIEGDKLIISETSYMDFPGGFVISKNTGAQLQLHYSFTSDVSSAEQYLNLKK